MSLQGLVEFVRDVYQTSDFIPLHAPNFSGNEKEYVLNTIDSTFVSSVGQYVNQFELEIEKYTGCAKAVATVNGTAALHASLFLAGVSTGDIVITQALTFVATCNAIHHLGATPAFVDIERQSLGMCPDSLEGFLQENAQLNDAGQCIHKDSGNAIKCVVPMHTFGHPVQLDEILAVCQKWNLLLIEDAAESLGSFYKEQHTGTIGHYSALSFNGNKIITTGAGGMVLCSNEKDGAHAKHVTTTAKTPHPYEYFHDEPGFNYRLPNLNAALGCAQMERLQAMLENKRQLAQQYQAFFSGNDDLTFVQEPAYAKSNYWLNAVICPDLAYRNELLSFTNDKGVMTRPVWQLMHRLPMYADSPRSLLSNAEWAEARLVNIPSSPTGLDN